MMKPVFGSAFAAALALSTATLGQQMIACDHERALFEIDLSLGTQSQYGLLSSNIANPTSLTFDEADGVAYLIDDSTNSLFTMDVSTGQATRVGSFGGTGYLMQSIEAVPGTDYLYGLGSEYGDLYLIDKATAASTSIGRVGLIGPGCLGYVAETRTMYLANAVTNSMYTVDLESAATRLVGRLNESTQPTDLAYNPDDGRLYLIDNALDRLFWIDMTNGFANIIGPTGVGMLVGLAYVPAKGSGPRLRLSGSCPGTLTLTWADASPDSRMGVVFASNTGSLIVPGGPCQGAQLGLGPQNIRLVNTINSGIGGGQVNGNAGTGACGGFLQLVVVDGSPCSTSNVAPIP